MTDTPKLLTPIERMIDAACGYNQPRKLTIKEISERVAEEIIGHIDTMYPAMWKPVAKNARRSLRGCVINTVAAALREFQK